MNIRYFIFPLIFFPSITFGLVPAEIFPWAFIVAIFYFKKNYKDFLKIIIIFLPSIIIAIYANVATIDIIRSLFAYLNVFFIFIVVLKFNDKDLNILIKVLKYSLILIILITIIQYLIPQINMILQYLVPRLQIYSSGVFKTDYAGHSGLSSEPSRHASEVIMLYVTYVLVSNNSKYLRIVKDTFVALFILLLNRSISGIFFLSIYAFIIYIDLIKNFKFLFFSIFILILSLIFIFTVNWTYIFNLSFFDFKSLNFIKQLYEFQNIQLIFDKIWYWSGFRFSSILSAYLNPTFFGYGMGNWYQASSIGYDLNLYLKTSEWFVLHCSDGIECGHRPTALLAGLILEIGIIPIIILALFLRKIVNKNYDTGKFNIPKNINIKFIWLFILSLVLLGNIGDPVVATCIAILFNAYYKNFYRKKIETKDI